MDTLVLSDAYLPIDRVSWQRAITLVLSGRADVVEEYEDRYIRSPSTIFPMPSVIRFVKRIANLFRRGVKFNRKNVWLRDKGRCQYCQRKTSLADFTFDHVVPQSQGGPTRWENIVVACPECNHRKRDRTPQQAKMFLRTPPARPKSLPGVSFPIFRWDDNMPKTWKDYLGSYQYWNGALKEDPA